MIRLFISAFLPPCFLHFFALLSVYERMQGDMRGRRRMSLSLSPETQKYRPGDQTGSANLYRDGIFILRFQPGPVLLPLRLRLHLIKFSIFFLQIPHIILRVKILPGHIL